jgi:hypothetical protein
VPAPPENLSVVMAIICCIIMLSETSSTKNLLKDQIQYMSALQEALTAIPITEFL